MKPPLPPSLRSVGHLPQVNPTRQSVSWVGACTRENQLRSQVQDSSPQDCLLPPTPILSDRLQLWCCWLQRETWWRSAVSRPAGARRNSGCRCTCGTGHPSPPSASPARTDARTYTRSGRSLGGRQRRSARTSPTHQSNTRPNHSRVFRGSGSERNTVFLALSCSLLDDRSESHRAPRPEVTQRAEQPSGALAAQRPV